LHGRERTVMISVEKEVLVEDEDGVELDQGVAECAMHIVLKLLRRPGRKTAIHVSKNFAYRRLKTAKACCVFGIGRP
jgi:hypothetical protein